VLLNSNSVIDCHRIPKCGLVAVVSKTGRAEIATDPMSVEVSDVLIMLKAA
jgi:Cu/Ag efflux pump CusA